MTTKFFLAAVAATLLTSLPGNAQTGAELLQKGIYAQETAGDLDTAIRIFRQAADPSSPNRSVAAQAQYQLVLCMLQRGDRAGAAKEVETLARNFADQPELISRARKLLPGGSALLPPPWGDSECSQLNIKRDGVSTGETLYYSVDPSFSPRQGDRPPTLEPNLQWLRWELTTKKSKRSVQLKADRSTGQPAAKLEMSSNDEVGDPAVGPLAGPAIDVQLSLFALRRLPLVVGYKTKLTTLPLTLAHLAPEEVELAVTGIEAVEVTAGRFKCYKVSFASLGQTFWIGIERSRPLVKFKSGSTEAELVKTWETDNFIETELSFLSDLGWKFIRRDPFPGPDSSGWFGEEYRPGERMLGFGVKAKKIYTPAADISEALRASLPKGEDACRPETIQTRTIGGQQAVSCIVPANRPDWGYHIWILSESASFELSASDPKMAILRWQLDQVLAKAKRIP